MKYRYRVTSCCNNRPLDALPGGRFNRRVHGSLVKADMLRAQRPSLDSRPGVPAADMGEAVLMASSFPWARTGAIGIRPPRDIKLVRQRAGV